MADTPANRPETPQEQSMTALGSVHAATTDGGDETTSTARTLRRRGAALIGLRIATGTVGIAVAAVTVLTAGLVPLPRVQSVAPSALVTPVPAAQLLTCPGSILRLGDELGQSATTPTAVGQPSVDYGGTTTEITTSSLSVSDAGTDGTASAPLVLSLGPSGEGLDGGPQQSLLSGAQVELPSVPDFTGMAAASCRGASSETWLVGGSADVGRTTLVTLANPSDVASTVALGIFGENGEVVAAGATGIVVQPRGQRVISLAGFAPGINSPVVRVSSQGGQIVASLQQVTVRGLDAGGVDIVGAGASPATVQVIPGVVVNGSLAVSESLGAQGFEDLAPIVRLLVTGDTAANVTVTIAPDSLVDSDESGGDEADAGESGGTSFSLELAAGRVTDIPIEDVSDGIYTISIASSEPVAAGARVSTVSEAVSTGDVAGSATRRPATSDFAWFSPATALSGTAIFTVAQAPGAQLHLHNPGRDDVTVVLANVGGGERPVFVAAGGSATVGVSPSSSIVLGGFESLFASVSFLGDAQLASYTVSPPAPESGPLLVYVK